jgi:NACalpha-BTF3-like transcription factor
MLNNFSQLGEITQVSKVISILQLDPEQRSQEDIDLIINQVEVSPSIFVLT